MKEIIENVQLNVLSLDHVGHISEEIQKRQPHPSLIKLGLVLLYNLTVGKCDECI